MFLCVSNVLAFLPLCGDHRASDDSASLFPKDPPCVEVVKIVSFCGDKLLDLLRRLGASLSVAAVVSSIVDAELAHA